MALVEIKHVTKRYTKHKVALDDVSLTMEEGRIIGLLGPNGSGKTTLIKLLAGLLSANGGTITVDGNAIGVETKKVVSYLPDVSYINENQKISQVISYFADFYADFEPDRAVAMLENLNIDVNLKYKTLSKGMKEKVQLVLVMSRRAKLYLLDEPIAGVDPASRDYILKTIIQNYDPTATILMSTHLISDIEHILDDIIFINDAKVGLVSTVDDIRETQEKSVDEYFREVYRC
ncbi:ABC transporter ATP-binding protein [Bengtsoniella intestinalis]|uniref:ABC transporter ATP-binding protein n=1 Tax=Bengtsoniella intestinalis TaxID=3073143 RepID=UPI00391F293E